MIERAYSAGRKNNDNDGDRSGRPPVLGLR